MNIHRMNRLISLLLVLALCGGLMTSAVFAADPQPTASAQIPADGAAFGSLSSSATASTVSAWSNDAVSKSTLRQLIANQTLYPQRSGWDKLDQRIAYLLSTCSEGTYNKLYEMYDWLVKSATYTWDGYSYTSASVAAYNSFTYNYLKNMTYESGLQKAYPDDLANHAYHMLMYKQGVCYDYAIAFVAVARYLGIDAYFRTGGFVMEEGGYSLHHGWAVLILGGQEYVFDLQRDARNWQYYRRTDYYFGVPASRNWRYNPNWTTTDRNSNNARAQAMLPVASHRNSSVTVTANHTGEGTVSGSGTYNSGSSVTLTATPAQGYRFTGWYSAEDALLSSDPTYTFTVTANTTVNAKFAKEYYVRVVGEGGTVSGTGNFIAGEKAVLTVVPDSGKYLDGWYDRLGRLMSQESTYSFTVRGNTTITLKMKDLAVVNVVASRSGTASGGGAYMPGTEVTVTAEVGETPLAGWYDAYGNLLTQEAVYSFRANYSQTLYALFEGDVFADIPAGAWYAASAMEAVSRGILSGTSAVTFSPNNYFTRAMAAAMLYRLEGADASELEKAPFDDVPDASWYTKPVNWAYANGVISGRSPTEFAPNDQVTREEFYAMVVRYMAMKGYTATLEDPLPFTDTAEIAAWATRYMETAYAMGLVSGYLDGTVLPKSSLTRAEGTSIIVRVGKYMETHEPELPEQPDPTEPDPTEPDPTEPDPTEPDPTEPNPTEPDPNADTGSNEEEKEPGAGESGTGSDENPQLQPIDDVSIQPDPTNPIPVPTDPTLKTE